MREQKSKHFRNEERYKLPTINERILAVFINFSLGLLLASVSIVASDLLPPFLYLFAALGFFRMLILLPIIFYLFISFSEAFGFTSPGQYFLELQIIDRKSSIGNSFQKFTRYVLSNGGAIGILIATIHFAVYEQPTVSKILFYSSGIYQVLYLMSYQIFHKYVNNDYELNDYLTGTAIIKNI